MGCILIQLDNSPESLAAVKHLHSTSEYLFDRTSSNLRLIPIFIFLTLTLTMRDIIIRLLVSELVVGELSHDYENICGGVVLLAVRS